MSGSLVIEMEEEEDVLKLASMANAADAPRRARIIIIIINTVLSSLYPSRSHL